MIYKAEKQPITLKNTLWCLLGVFVIGLVWLNLKDMILGVPLSIATAADGATIDTPFLPITGIAKHARALSINGRPIAIDRQGKFDDEVVLSPGYNIVEIAMKDQFGNEKQKSYQIVVKENTAVASIGGTPYQ